MAVWSLTLSGPPPRVGRGLGTLSPPWYKKLAMLDLGLGGGFHMSFWGNYSDIQQYYACSYYNIIAWQWPREVIVDETTQFIRADRRNMARSPTTNLVPRKALFTTKNRQVPVTEHLPSNCRRRNNAAQDVHTKYQQSMQSTIIWLSRESVRRTASTRTRLRTSTSLPRGSVWRVLGASSRHQNATARSSGKYKIYRKIRSQGTAISAKVSLKVSINTRRLWNDFSDNAHA